MEYDTNKWKEGVKSFLRERDNSLDDIEKVDCELKLIQFIAAVLENND